MSWTKLCGGRCVTVYIKLINNARGPIALVDNETAGSYCVPIDRHADTGWVIKAGGDDQHVQAIIGPGEFQVGPGTFDWIRENGDWKIFTKRAGADEWAVLLDINWAKPNTNPPVRVVIAYVTITYGADGKLHAVQTY